MLSQESLNIKRTRSDVTASTMETEETADGSIEKNIDTFQRYREIRNQAHEKMLNLKEQILIEKEKKLQNALETMMLNMNRLSNVTTERPKSKELPPLSPRRTIDVPAPDTKQTQIATRPQPSLAEKPKVESPQPGPRLVMKNIPEMHPSKIDKLKPKSLGSTPDPASHRLQHVSEIKKRLIIKGNDKVSKASFPNAIPINLQYKSHKNTRSLTPDVEKIVKFM